MINQENLFNRKLLRIKQQRFAKDFDNHNFLYHEIANRIIEDINYLNQNFKKCLEIGARDGYLSSSIKNISSTFQTNLSIDFNTDRTILADEELLPFKSNSFDLVASNLNLHFINQIPHFLLQVKDILAPDGFFIASFFGEENLSELRKVLFEAENKIYCGASPIMPPTIDIKTAANLLSKAGFFNPISYCEKVEVTYHNPFNLLKDLQKMGQGNIMNKRNKRFFTKNFLSEILKTYYDLYSENKNTVPANYSIIIISGWKKTN